MYSGRGRAVVDACTQCLEHLMNLDYILKPWKESQIVLKVHQALQILRMCSSPGLPSRVKSLHAQAPKETEKGVRKTHLVFLTPLEGTSQMYPTIVGMGTPLLSKQCWLGCWHHVASMQWYVAGGLGGVFRKYTRQPPRKAYIISTTPQSHDRRLCWGEAVELSKSNGTFLRAPVPDSVSKTLRWLVFPQFWARSTGLSWTLLPL